MVTAVSRNRVDVLRGRRRLLGCLLAALTSSLPGCSSGSTNEPPAKSDKVPAPAPPRKGGPRQPKAN